MPFIPLSLHDLLENPKCSPYLPLKQAPKLGQGPRLTSSTISRFGTIAKSFLYQIVAAVMFLHTNSQPIAHRDIKPSNILVRPDGCVKLIDFGISWEDRPRGHGASFEEPRGDDGNGRLNEFFDMPRPEWDETPERMCCQVSSGYACVLFFGIFLTTNWSNRRQCSPYRAPELLFAPRHYDAFATDLWSLGVLASSFFTSLRFDPKETVSTLSHFDWDALVLQNDTGAHNTDAAVVNELPDPTIPFNIPNSVTETEGAGTWHRMFLFDSTRGEIGLVASIFKLLGTPTDTSWPVSSSPTSIHRV
jgi:serine/threonine protein kinase